MGGSRLRGRKGGGDEWGMTRGLEGRGGVECPGEGRGGRNLDAMTFVLVSCICIVLVC